MCSCTPSKYENGGLGVQPEVCVTFASQAFLRFADPAFFADSPIFRVSVIMLEQFINPNSSIWLLSLVGLAAIALLVYSANVAVTSSWGWRGIFALDYFHGGDRSPRSRF